MKGLKIIKYLVLLIIVSSVFIILGANVFADWNVNAVQAEPHTDTEVTLTWPSIPNAASYYVYRGIDPGNITDKITENGISVSGTYDPCTYTDTGLIPNTTYYYEVRAYSSLTEDPATLITTGWDHETTSDIVPPANVTPKYNVNTQKIELSWTNVTNTTISSITVERDSDTQELVRIPSNPISITFGDPISTDGQISFYNLILNDDISSSVSFSVTPAPEPVITASVQSGIASVSWGSYSRIDEFELQRSRFNGTTWDAWQTAKTTLAGSSTTDITPEGGSYRYRLNAKASSSLTGTSGISSIVVVPRAPGGLALAIDSPNSISLRWTNEAGNRSDLQIKRLQPDGTYLTLDTLLSSESTYTDNLSITTGTTYTYMITAYGGVNNTSDSATVSITAAMPTAPSGLTVTINSSTSMQLNWTDNSNNEAGLRIERKDDSGAFTQIATVSANTATYTDIVAGAHTYTYRVMSYNGLGNSAYSNEVVVGPSDNVAPSTLTVLAVSSSQIDLVWTYPGTGSYQTAIERKTGTSGNWTLIRTTASGVLKYSDTGLSPNTQYFYRVRNSPSSGVLTASWPNNNNGTGAYTLLGGLSLTGSASSGNTIHLSWSGASGSSDIIIERKVANGSFAVLATVSSSTTGWYDNTGLVPGATYTYRIKAKSSTNESVYSNEAAVQNYYLIAPSNLTASVNADQKVELKWTDNSSDETGFEIWRHAYGTASFALYATVGKNTTSYTDDKVQTGTQYYYMVRAFSTSNSQYSPYTNTISIGTGLISPPTDLKASYVSTTQVLLKWTDTSSDESGFKVEWKIGEEGDWNVYAWLSSNTVSYNVTGLNQYITYYFRIRAFNYLNSADSISNELQVSTALPKAPSEVTAVAISSEQIKLKWKDNSANEAGFRILRTTSNLSYYMPVAEVGPDITTYSDRGLTAGVRYLYKIVSYNYGGSSESPEASATTVRKVTFEDVNSKVSWAKDAIGDLAGRGIIKGDGKLFKPLNKISKAEFVAIILRAFEIETNPVGSFADVKVNKWYYKDVMTAENLGLISGDSKNMFHPEAAITREEMAVMIQKTLELVGKPLAGHDNSVLEKFKDRDLISPDALSSMAALVGEGIMNGVSSSALGPKSTSNRAEAAVLIYNILNR